MLRDLSDGANIFIQFVLFAMLTRLSAVYYAKRNRKDADGDQQYVSGQLCGCMTECIMQHPGVRSDAGWCIIHHTVATPGALAALPLNNSY